MNIFKNTVIFASILVCLPVSTHNLQAVGDFNDIWHFLVIEEEDADNAKVKQEIRTLLEDDALEQAEAGTPLPPLPSAVMMRLYRIVETHIKQGTDINKEDEKGFLPLHLAAAHGYNEIVELLLDNNANIDQKTSRNLQTTALHWAVQRERVEVVRTLVTRKASLSMQDGDGDTPLQTAQGFLLTHRFKGEPTDKLEEIVKILQDASTQQKV